MYDENDLIFSDLQQSYVANGNSVRIEIYRMPDSGWTLEVVDVHNNSTVWDDEFPTDKAALDQALKELTESGIEAFVGPARGESTH
jgi:hypothetical protein